MVVSNTSPLMNLAIIDRLDLLRQIKTGALGILLFAKEQNLIPSFKDEMDKLQREAHFWISSPLYKKLLQAAGE